MITILGGRLQIGDIIFGNAKIVRLDDQAAEVDCGGKVYSIGLDPARTYDAIRPGPEYTSVVIATADWLDQVRIHGASHATPGNGLIASWKGYSDEFLDQIFADARRTLVAAGSITAEERI